MADSFSKSPTARHVPVVPVPVLDSDTPDQIAAKIEEIPAPDAAGMLEVLEVDRAARTAEALDPNTAARILSQMDTATASVIVAAMEPPEAAMLVGAMDPDDRVDILENLDADLRAQLMQEMTVAEADEVRALEKYPPDTAGGIMTTQVTSLFEYLTVENAISLLRKLSEELEQMFYVYVVNRQQQLVGVLSMRDLILARPSRTLREIMIPNVRSVPATMDQEQVAQLMRKYGYLAMPVVDAESKLVGLITVDDVVDILEEEMTEDVQRMFGAGAEERLNSPWFFSFRKRVWWLIINLGTAFLAAAVVGMFEDTITQLAILAAYMPIVAGMGGNASAQAMAVAVRGLVIGRVDRALLIHVIKSQFLVGLLTGLIVGLLTMIIALVFHSSGSPFTQSLALGFVVFLALVINHTLACTTGASIPFLMKKLGFDPAQSATILATTVTDIAGFFCLLGLARLFIRWLI